MRVLRLHMLCGAPSYNDPKFYLPLESNVFACMSRNFAASRSGLRRAVRECLARLGLLQHLEYSFAILATK